MLRLRTAGALLIAAALATNCADDEPTRPGAPFGSTTATQVSTAITHTLLTSGNNTVNQKVYSTAAIAPAPNTLITIAVLGHNSTSALAYCRPVMCW